MLRLIRSLSLSVLVALLVACASPAAAPTATPLPATATPTFVQPTATLAPTVIAVPAPADQAPVATPASPGSEEQAPDVLSGFVENDGVKIHYEVEGKGPPLILLHWWTGSIEDWRLFGYVDALKDDYRLILIDARGHGQSDKPHEPAAYVLEQQVGDIIAVLDELGIDKAHYFGYSMGGTLGWAFAKYAPDRLASLIIGGEAPENYDSSGDISRIRELGAEGWGRMVADIAGHFGFSQPEVYVVYAANDLEAVTADSQSFSAENFAPDLPGMTMPILLLAGTKDGDYPAIKAATDKLPNATFASLMGQDHATAFMETDLILEHVTKFLAHVEKATLDDATIAKIEAIVRKAMIQYPVPGMTMCILKDGAVVYSKGFGMADTESKRSMTPRSVSTEYSISKSVTALAILQLVEQGKIDLDKPVTAYLPYFTMADSRYKDITVRMLLNHTSGMVDSPTVWEDPLDPTMNPLEQAVRGLSDQQLLFAPGEGWNYSGWGYSVLGDIIARVTGEPFADYMQQHWLSPLGMANSTYLPDEVDPSLRVTGYYTASGSSIAAGSECHDPRDAPACALLSNCDDMSKLAQLLLSQGELNGTRFLQPETIDAMWTAHAETDARDALGPWYGPPFAEYGLGWQVGEKDGHRLAGHAGGGTGYNTQLQFAPDDDLAVIAMDNWLNAEPDWYPASFAAIDVMYELLGIEAPAQ